MSHDKSVTICLPGEGVHDLTQQPDVNLQISQKEIQVVEIATGPMGPTGRVDSGSFLVTASADVNGIVFTKGDGTTFPVTTGMVYIDTANNMQSSSLQTLTIYDYDNVNTVSFSDNDLTIVLGTPTAPTIGFTSTGFLVDRFNRQVDEYNLVGSFNIGVYGFVSTQIYEGATLLTSSLTNTSPLTYNITNSSGSHTYTFVLTSINPLTSTAVVQSTDLTLEINKSEPGNPTISITDNTLYLGLGNYQIEYGDFGSISYEALYGTLNGWEQHDIYLGADSPYAVNQTDGFYLQAYATYRSPYGANVPDPIYRLKTRVDTYTRIRSVRYGTSAQTSFTESEIMDLPSWVTGIGTILKGTSNPIGIQASMAWTGPGRHMYLITDASQPTPNVAYVGGISHQFQTLFTTTIVGGYKVHRSELLAAPFPGDPNIYQFL